MTYKQGSIVKLNFDPTKGHEQAGYRPALVVSRTMFNKNMRQIVVCPITSKSRRFPTRIPLDDRTQTQGYIICDQIRTLDVDARKPRLVEELPEDLLKRALNMVVAIFEKE